MPATVRRATLGTLVRLPPGSHLRRRLLKRLTVRALAANSRGDFDYGLLIYDPAVELRVLGSVARALGLADSYQGHHGVRALWSAYQRDTDGLRAEPEVMIDLGERIALRVTLVGTGRMSGATTRNTEGFILHISSRGTITRHEIYWTWEDALAALDAPAPAARPA